MIARTGLRPAVFGVLFAGTLLLAGGAARADRIDDLMRTVMTDRSHKVRTQAVIVLGKLGDPRAVEVLIQALGDESASVRGAAAAALGRLRDGRAVPALEPLRNDASSFVRDSATKALAAIVGPAAAPPPRPATAPGMAAPTYVPGMPPPTSPANARHFVDVHVTGPVPPQAREALRWALADEVGRLPKVTTATARPTSRKGSAWVLDASITRLAPGPGSLECDVSLMVIAMPAASIRATTTAGAAVGGVNPYDPTAHRDCLAGTARQLAQQVSLFFRTQP